MITPYAIRPIYLGELIDATSIAGTFPAYIYFLAVTIHASELSNFLGAI